MTAQCIQKGCQNPPAKKGYCDWHYRRRIELAATVAARARPSDDREIHESEFLYVIGVAGNPFFKVGRSSDPVKRMANLQCAIPIDLKLEAVFCVASSGAEKLERSAHRALASHNVRGEWFRLSREEIIEAVKNCAGEIEAAIIEPAVAMALCREVISRAGTQDEILGFEEKLKRIAAVMQSA